jgi:hypothetical protein
MLEGRDVVVLMVVVVLAAQPLLIVGAESTVAPDGQCRKGDVGCNEEGSSPPAVGINTRKHLEGKELIDKYKQDAADANEELAASDQAAYRSKQQGEAVIAKYKEMIKPPPPPSPTRNSEGEKMVARYKLLMADENERLMAKERAAYRQMLVDQAVAAMEVEAATQEANKKGLDAAAVKQKFANGKTVDHSVAAAAKDFASKQVAATQEELAQELNNEDAVAANHIPLIRTLTPSTPTLNAAGYPLLPLLEMLGSTMFDWSTSTTPAPISRASVLAKDAFLESVPSLHSVLLEFVLTSAASAPER